MRQARNLSQCRAARRVLPRAVGRRSPHASSSAHPGKDRDTRPQRPGLWRTARRLAGFVQQRACLHAVQPHPDGRSRLPADHADASVITWFGPNRPALRRASRARPSLSRRLLHERGGHTPRRPYAADSFYPLGRTVVSRFRSTIAGAAPSGAMVQPQHARFSCATRREPCRCPGHGEWSTASRPEAPTRSRPVVSRPLRCRGRR